MQHDAARPGKFIIGLPVPAASSVLVSIVVLNHQLAGSFVDVSQASLALLVIVLSYLMVSRIRFRSFKDLRLSRRSVTGGLFILAFMLLAIANHFHSAMIFVMLVAAYLGLGLAEEVLFYRRRRDEERAAKETSAPPPLAEGGARSDEEVLEELGAFDQEDEGEVSTPELTPRRS
jgi:CDP-diacylglycerol--serine O-phosphatidyltransferase